MTMIKVLIMIIIEAMTWIMIINDDDDKDDED